MALMASLRESRATLSSVFLMPLLADCFWHFVDVCVYFIYIYVYIFFLLSFLPDFSVVVLFAGWLVSCILFLHFLICVSFSFFFFPVCSMFARLISLSLSLFRRIRFYFLFFIFLTGGDFTHLISQFLFYFILYFWMADSACATHTPSPPLRLSDNPSPPPLVQHGRIHMLFPLVSY